MNNNEVEKHKILKQAAEYSYDVQTRTRPAGYDLLGVGMMNNGFYACVLKKDNNIIISFRGTERKDINDLKNDITMGFKLPDQVKSALSLYDGIHREYPNCGITLTGHSLGGSLAQIVGAIRNASTVTFNAFGTKHLLEKSGYNIYSDQIVNYCNPNDTITTGNAKNHIGKCYKINSSGTGLDLHFTENMHPLESRIEITPEELDMRVRARKRAQEEWEYYKRTGKHKPIGMSSGCVGSYPVSGYTRSDGTKVSDYIRTCGAKHNK